MSVTAYVGLGSNLGDRAAYLDRAMQALQSHPRIEVTQVSSFYETEPEGGPADQGPYLNAVAELRTEMTPEELLVALFDVEDSLGRVRRERYGPRTIDLDLLLYEDLVQDKPSLTIPHPRMHRRGFVLEPLSEIAPDAVHPVLGKTFGELWNDFDPDDADDEEISHPESVAAGTPRPASPAAPRVQRVAAPAGRGDDLRGKVALVTGSTSGIGRAIALELAAAGAEVIVHGRNAEAADEVADLIDEAGGTSRVLLGDLVKLEECRNIVATAWEEWGPIDVWVNNAGADVLTGEAGRWPFAHRLRELFEVDVMATLLMSRDVGRRMQDRGSGVIINMGWDKADVGMEGDSGQLFAATKAAVMAFSKSLALTLAPEVRVNCLAPGWIQTAWGRGASQEWQERVIDETPLERWGTAQDVARAARWLASDGAEFVTGQVIRVNGGVVR